MFKRRITYLFLFLSLAFSNRAVACHGLPLVNITFSVSGGNLIINAESDAATCGCDPYRFEIELTCINSSFDGVPNYFSATMVKTGCNQEPYPALIVPIGSLCPGTTYQWRAREFVLGATPDDPLGPWSSANTFTTPGVITPITATASASPASLCIPNSSTITAAASGGCGSGYKYTWDNGLGTGSTVTVSPMVTTTYNVTVTDACSGYSQIVPVTVNVGQAPIAGTATATPSPVCSGGSTTVTLSSYSGNIQWQTAPSPGGPWTNVSGGNGSSFVFGPLTATKFVRAIVSGTCGGTVFSNTLIIQVVQKPTITVSNSNICEGNNATLTATPSASGGTYSWSNSATTQSINVSPAVSTTYSVIYTINGCSSDPATSTVTVQAKPVVTINSAVICIGDTALLQASSDLGGGNYIWSTGETTSSISVSPSQTNNYYAINTLNGCKSDTTFTQVTVKPIPVISLNDTSICNGNSITLTASPSLAGGTFSWSPSGNTSSTLNVNPSTTTTYTVNYTLNGCMAIPDEGIVTVKPVPSISISNTTICNGQTGTLTATPDITGGTFLWNNSLTSNSITVSPSVTTNYSAVYTLNGCSSTSSSASVIVNPSPVVTSNNSTICLGQTATLNANPDVSGGTFLWLPGNETTNSITVSPLSTSTFTVSYTLNGCTDTAISTVTVNTLSGVSAGSDIAICSGSSTVLTASGANNYQWSNGSVNSSITVSPNVTTSYFLTGFANTCSGKDTVTVIVSQPLVISASKTDLSCNNICNGTISINTSGGIGNYNYSWIPSVSTTSMANSLCSGNYKIIINDSLGCADSISMNLSQPSPLLYSISVSNTSCYGICDGTAQIIVNGGTSPYTYLWQNGDNRTFADSLCGGTQIVDITDSNGCLLHIDTTIYEPAAITAIISPSNSTICIGSSVSLQANATGGSGNYSYLWSNGSTSSTLNASPTQTTQYSIIVSDANGCSSPSANASIQVRDSIHVLINHQIEVCAGISTVLSASVTGGDGIYNFVWQPGNLTGPSISVTPTESITYTVFVTDGCTTPGANISATINITPSPVANFVADTTFVCAGGCILFTDSSTAVSGSTNSYLWSFSDGSSNTHAQFIQCFNQPGTYDVNLIVTSDISRCRDTISLENYITVGSLPVADFTMDPENPTDIDPTVNFQNTTIFSDQWLWSFGDSLTSFEKDPSHTFPGTGTYCITLYAENNLGCKDSTIKCITVKPEKTIYIPNSFTPNGDNLNNVFKAYAAGWDPNIFFEMRIFNRWGNQIFSSNDIQIGWDGKGSAPANGIDTYVYRIEIKDKTDHRILNGHINLIR